MAKRVSMIGLVCIAVMIFFIWRNPSGTADTVSDFLGSVGHVVSEAWDRLGEFVRGLAD
ncbi:MAG: hypothetical protein IT195_03675 [Microthrixaceae bacterium]|nr:hypothetical protein [Microthrixaceae bacterium]